MDEFISFIKKRIIEWLKNKNNLKKITYALENDKDFMPLRKTNYFYRKTEMDASSFIKCIQEHFVSDIKEAKSLKSKGTNIFISKKMTNFMKFLGIINFSDIHSYVINGKIINGKYYDDSFTCSNCNQTLRVCGCIAFFPIEKAYYKERVSEHEIISNKNIRVENAAKLRYKNNIGKFDDTFYSGSGEFLKKHSNYKK